MGGAALDYPKLSAKSWLIFVMSEVTATIEPPSQMPPRRFRVSLLIRATLLCLYVSLTLPLPSLAVVSQASVAPSLLWFGIGLGGLVVYGGLSEQVVVNAEGIGVSYPTWIAWLFRRQWQLSWPEITALKPRSTGQGGLVYYFTSTAADRAYLLPMRMAGFAELLRYVEAYTSLDTRDVKPLAQPWMYVMLLGCSLLLFVVDVWVLWTAGHLTEGGLF